MRVLVVGQAPSRDTDGRPPFSGRSGERLAELLGVEHVLLRRHVDVVNLLDHWPGKCGKGDRFPMPEARAAARMLLAVAPHDRIVACGIPVARALGMIHPAPLERRVLLGSGGRLVLMLPHPSGVNRWWNEPSNQRSARAALRAFVGPDLLAAGA